METFFALLTGETQSDNETFTDVCATFKTGKSFYNRNQSRFFCFHGRSLHVLPLVFSSAGRQMRMACSVKRSKGQGFFFGFSLYLMHQLVIHQKLRLMKRATEHPTKLLRVATVISGRDETPPCHLKNWWHTTGCDRRHRRHVVAVVENIFIDQEIQISQA